jgi:hypothetical protein
MRINNATVRMIFKEFLNEDIIQVFTNSIKEEMRIMGTYEEEDIEKTKFEIFK